MFYSILYKYRLVILTYAHFLCSAHKCQLVLVLLVNRYLFNFEIMSNAQQKKHGSEFAELPCFNNYFQNNNSNTVPLIVIFLVSSYNFQFYNKNSFTCSILALAYLQ